MFINYQDACEAEIDRQTALRAVRNHDGDEAEFLAEVGDQPIYRGQEVLDWLGY